MKCGYRAFPVFDILHPFISNVWERVRLGMSINHALCLLHDSIYFSSNYFCSILIRLSHHLSLLFLSSFFNAMFWNLLNNFYWPFEICSWVIRKSFKTSIIFKTLNSVCLYILIYLIIISESTPRRIRKSILTQFELNTNSLRPHIRKLKRSYEIEEPVWSCLIICNSNWSKK